jgi:hypothetical protein
MMLRTTATASCSARLRLYIALCQFVRAVFKICAVIVSSQTRDCSRAQVYTPCATPSLSSCDG